MDIMISNNDERRMLLRQDITIASPDTRKEARKLRDNERNETMQRKG
jgi:hypothetical protein